MGDDWFGYRNPLTGAPFKDADRNEWTQWDYLLATVDQTIEDLTDSNGLYVWETHDPKQRVRVDAVRKIDPFEAAKQSTTGRKNYKPKPGEYFVPHLTKTVEEWPTLREYLESGNDTMDE